MRTTITLDPDVERPVTDAMSEQDLSFVQRSFDCGPFLVDPATNFNHLADAVEDQEIAAKLAQGR